MIQTLGTFLVLKSDLTPLEFTTLNFHAVFIFALTAHLGNPDKQII